MYLPLHGKLQGIGPGNESSLRCLGTAADGHRHLRTDKPLLFGPARSTAGEEIHQVEIFPPREVTEALVLQPKGRLLLQVSVSEKGRKACELARTRASPYPDGVYSFCTLLSTVFLKKPGGNPADASSFFRGREREGGY
jgi:hypothetical protein